MPSNTTRLALPYPVPDDTVDVPRDVKALAEKIDPGLPIVVAATPPASPVAGQQYFNTTTGALYTWNGTAWVTATPPVEHFQTLGNGTVPNGGIQNTTPMPHVLTDGSPSQNPIRVMIPERPYARVLVLSGVVLWAMSTSVIDTSTFALRVADIGNNPLSVRNLTDVSDAAARSVDFSQVVALPATWSGYARLEFTSVGGYTRQYWTGWNNLQLAATTIPVL